MNPVMATIGWAAGALGLASSVFHLGQPLRAWRIFLGLRKSWLSREALVFGAWFALATAYTGLSWVKDTSVLPRWIHSAEPLGWAVVASGIVGLACSVMIYADTRRPFWRIAQTGPRFFGAAVVLACAIAGCVHPSVEYTLGLIGALLFKLAVETRALRALDSNDDRPSPAWHTAQPAQN